MKVFRSMGKVVKPFVNFPGWMGWRQISATTHTLKELIQRVFGKASSKPRETFEQAVLRLRLNEKALQEKQASFLKLAIFYALFAIAMLGYTVYLSMTTHHLFAVLLTIVLSLVLWAYAYREHFWYFQLKKRKLGCTFKEWVAFTFRGAK